MSCGINCQEDEGKVQSSLAAHSCIIAVPIYKPQLSAREEESLKTSFENLKGFPKTWVAPLSIDKKYYITNFPDLQFSYFDDEFFTSTQSYNKLMLSNSIYERYIAFEFILICQPDAIVLKPELHFWLNQPYDYIGAPWPMGWRFYVPSLIRSGESVLCSVFVGNGGLSLRRTNSMLRLFSEFSEARDQAVELSMQEDLFISACANYSANFRCPNIRIAAKFAHEVTPEFLMKFENEPFGIHGWNRLRSL